MIRGGNEMKYSSAKRNGRKMRENMFTSGKARIIFKYFCFNIAMLITMLTVPMQMHKEFQKKHVKRHYQLFNR